MRRLHACRWLAEYDDLFTRRCAATGTLLAADAASGHFFPPLLRRFDASMTRADLVAAARGGPRAAYHPHAAPVRLLHQY